MLSVRTFTRSLRVCGVAVALGAPVSLGGDRAIATSDAKPTSPVHETGTRDAADAYGRLPLSFERNVGQVDARVEYLARGKGYTLFLTTGRGGRPVAARRQQPRVFPSPRSR